MSCSWFTEKMVTAFLFGVIDILLPSADEKMVRIDAAWNIAVMANEQAAWNVATEHLKRCPMRLNHFSAHPEKPIAVMPAASSPQPTATERNTLNFRIESTLQIC